MKNCVVLHDARNGWLHFHPARHVIRAVRLEDVIPALTLMEEMVRTQGLHAAGFISYEASPAFDCCFKVRNKDPFPLIWFGLYDRPERIELPPVAKSPDNCSMSWETGISQEDYKASIRRIKEYLKKGDTYQVNYTFRMRSGFEGDPWSFFVRLAHAQKAQYACFIDTEDFSVCSASPELFFTLDGEDLVSYPMKGTAPRGLTQKDDQEQAASLYDSEKNRAENLMIVDMVRNDMGRVALSGSVKVQSLFSIEKYPTLWQMTSKVAAQTKESLVGIVGALFPPASITGAPKTRTMHIISELETTPRGLYTGCIGYVSPDRQAQFNVAIRTAVIDKKKKEAFYGVGGGIVWDSNDALELEECRTKALVLTRESPDFSLMESILWTLDDGYFLLDEHLDRLESSARYCDFILDRQNVIQKLQDITNTFGSPAYKVRLLLQKEGRVSLNAEPLLMEQGARPPRIRLTRQPVDQSNWFLYHKTTNRHTYNEAIKACPGYDDVLLWNKKGELTESCIANVVVDMDGGLFTPPVECGLLGGVYRSWLIKYEKVRERVIKIDELQNCTRIYLINSVRKMREAILEPV
jgi:para-aminobenzoate synthetase / 4-amino-4-deoxychorismate lyase